MCVWFFFSHLIIRQYIFHLSFCLCLSLSHIHRDYATCTDIDNTFRNNKSVAARCTLNYFLSRSPFWSPSLLQEGYFNPDASFSFWRKRQVVRCRRHNKTRDSCVWSSEPALWPHKPPTFFSPDVWRLKIGVQRLPSHDLLGPELRDSSAVAAGRRLKTLACEVFAAALHSTARSCSDVAGLDDRASHLTRVAGKVHNHLHTKCCQLYDVTTANLIAYPWLKQQIKDVCYILQ